MIVSGFTVGVIVSVGVVVTDVAVGVIVTDVVVGVIVTNVVVGVIVTDVVVGFILTDVASASSSLRVGGGEFLDLDFLFPFVLALMPIESADKQRMRS